MEDSNKKIFQHLVFSNNGFLEIMSNVRFE